ANLKPELFNTLILDHPYLDVVNTMMNDTLPLTIDEYKEWGNPQDKEVYNYISDYSPYQNIKPQNYPNVLLVASYQDYQTPIWQIAKYTARLRENNLSDSEIIMLTDMSSGHIGNTTGKEWIKLFAEMNSFVKLKNDKPVFEK
ncbi:MAG: prolyl oligopeptidase family serine peptidase, partial [Bacteroidota bacterium]